MSEDSVDDLHQAEDLAGSCAQSLKELLALRDEYPWTGLADLHADGRGTDQLDKAATRVADWESYCRPTCGAEGLAGPGDGDCQDDDCCGCPCHDRFEAQS